MKKILSIILSALLISGLSGCSTQKDTSKETKVEDKKVIKVGATAVPHKEILEGAVKPLLEKQGYKLEIIEYTDYVLPNTALADGELDANYFQHEPYLNNMIKEKNLDLTYTVKVHLEPIALYSKKIKSLDELKDGAVIAVPNDSTNEARALRLLESQGLFKLKEGELVTKLDIDKASNTKNIQIKEVDAAQIPRSLVDFDAAVINSNYAMSSGLTPNTDSIVNSEGKHIIESTKDNPYNNILAVRKEDKDKPYIQALSKALTSPEVKKFIEDKYKGSVIPAF
ncbi:D-methionine transport system substrate-binding protein [Clostridium sp. USBA 49]|uniref:MetQ/NlpA family ABC transporter substrate-binding protein n=1 Tax=Clostridium sp. USBA 49 TaxID=1881060 RepID=UPI00099A748C|nr:MetQ/NlpA family ABC transporter substrate-binding protein [Clostridium sp. USBA 49]SKA75037.1 D-methionine transport system substrate-binding protein [Clostridium sp. USBA 49]